MNLKINTKYMLDLFLSATVQSMFDYVKPSIRENPNHVIIHAATNDIPSDKKSESIAQDMIHLAKKIRSKDCSVAISSIVPRNDKESWSIKANEVNRTLEEMCKELGLDFVNNDNINPKKLLNNGKLHLNNKGPKKLRSNFIYHIKKVLSS